MSAVTEKYEPWEYVVRTYDGAEFDAVLGSALNVDGLQEWELVAFDFQRGRAVFKRKVTLSQ